MVISAHIATDAIKELRVRVCQQPPRPACYLSGRSLQCRVHCPSCNTKRQLQLQALLLGSVMEGSGPSNVQTPGIISLLLLLLLIRFAFVMLSYYHPSRL